MTNATVHIEFPNFSTTYPVEWTPERFIEEEALGEYLMFNDDPQIVQAYMSGFPEVHVTLDSNPEVRSSVIMDDVSGLALPAWSLKDAKARAKKK